MKSLNPLFLATVVLFLLAACKEDEMVIPEPAEATFKVTIENVLADLPYLASGTSPFLMPGESTDISFHAGIGHRLSLATMFVQSNDLFYAFAEEGLALYDGNGNALSGDLSAGIDLWDAGTEVNEEPGVGPNQAPRQGAANTGDDENGLVHIVNDAFTYPADESVLKLTLTHDGGTLFTLSLENVSDGATLPTPLAPGVWVVHGQGMPLFSEGAAAGTPLERLAEDGDNAMLSGELATDTGYSSPFAPGVWVVRTAGERPLFENGQADRDLGLEALAEDGDPGALDAALSGSHGIFNTPDGAAAPGPLLPGNSYSFSFDAVEGEHLSLASMLVHTNDLFFAFADGGLALFENGIPVKGDISAEILLWDAGTEVNEYPGAGNHQPARGGADSGSEENGTVRPVADGFSYPAVLETIKVTIEVP